MKDKPTPDFAHFMRDTDGEYSKAIILKAARTLLAEGRRRDRVYMALITAALDLSQEHDESSRFLCNVRDWAGGIIEKRVEVLEKLEAENRAKSN